MPQSLRTLLVLVILLPQLAVASLGDGFVLCAAPGGHLQVEVFDGSCCEDILGSENQPVVQGQAGQGLPEESPDCPSCEDFVVHVDPTRPQRQIQTDTTPPRNLTIPVFLAVPLLDRTAFVRFQPSRPTGYLSVLRTTVIRC